MFPQTVYLEASNPVNLAISSKGRTVAQLPTGAIWNNFDLAGMLSNPFLGSVLITDFTGRVPWFNSFADATYAASAGGKTPTEHIYPGITDIGELHLFTTTDNQAAELQFPTPITLPTILVPATPFAFECRIKQSVLTTAKGGWFAGLMKSQKLVGDLIADTGILADVGCIGFQGKEGALGTGAVDYVYDKAGQTQNEYAAALATAVADTYLTVGMYYNGTTIQGYVNGEAAGTAIPNVNLDDADFPGGVVVVPTFAVKGASADDYTVSVDWVVVAQMGAM